MIVYDIKNVSGEDIYLTATYPSGLCRELVIRAGEVVHGVNWRAKIWLQEGINAGLLEAAPINVKDVQHIWQKEGF